MNSNAKGKVGERELANYLKGRGYEARRGQQFRGGSDSPDVVGVPGVYIECKRTERLALYDAVDQSRRDAPTDSVPTVWHRCNGSRRKSCRGDWLVILSADDFMELWEKVHGKPAPGNSEATGAVSPAVPTGTLVNVGYTVKRPGFSIE